jgi:tetratricopeptide (TPR) repeat protein
MYKAYQLLFQNGEIPDATEAGDHFDCIQALAMASKYQTNNAREAIGKILSNYPEHECSYLLEAKSLMYFSLREFTAAKEFAYLAIEKEPASCFAYSVLARLALFEKKYDEGSRCYKKILDYFPEKDKVKLDIAEAYILGGKYTLAQNLITETSKSVRKGLYQFRLLLNNLLFRVVLGIVFLALYTFPDVLVGVYMILTAGLLYIWTWHGYKKGDLVVIHFTIYLFVIMSILAFPGFCSVINNF